ncbi:uncharacterized protein LOC143280484 [Babylonia areolata]|uniref:uncharacterized protein LOC143280484 n=1 Tax=Babylonia areolata TaxID=304850 RepID=UPI003FD47F92
MAALQSTVVIAILILCSLGVQSKADDTEELVKEVLFKPETCERETKNHDMLSMHYTGTLTATGAKFDSSHDRNQPFEFQIGVGQVIQGWEKGLLDMCVGEKRKLIIPAHMGYGDQGAGELIPPKSSLTFEVELLDIKDGTPPQNIFKEIDADEDKLLSKEEISDFLKEQARKAGPDSGITDEQHNTIITEIFEHEDKDKDGFISHEEFSGPKHDEL